MPLSNSKPSPQQVQDSRDIDTDSVKEEEKKVENKKDEEDNNDIGKTVSDIFGGVLNLVSGALDTAEEIAGNEVNMALALQKIYKRSCCHERE